MRYAFVLMCLLVNLTTAVADDAQRGGFWGSIDIGFGNLYLDPAVADDSTKTPLYLGFQAGYTVHPQFQLGIEASGWNIESSELWNATKGEGLMQLFAVARYWPAVDSKLFLKMGAGNTTHWNNAPGATRGTGSGYCVGLAYEVARFGAMETHWFLNYNAGDVSGYTPQGGVKQDENYSVFSTGLSFGF